MKRQLLISTAIILFLLIGTGIAIIYGKGYRLDLSNLAGNHSFLQGTGLLVATSLPDGASVYINDHLTTATNNTINLAPGDYQVKIFKDGYFPWEKKIHVEKEVVSKADAILFPTAPKLESITDSGVLNPSLDPSSTKVAYTVASQSAKKNGIYIFDMGNRSLITLQSGSTQIADDTTAPFSTATLAWSPDGKQILATIPSVTASRPTIYLLDATTFNAAPQDVTETVGTIQASWDKLVAEKQKAQINTLPTKLRQFATDNMTIHAWSPDETKFVYVASESATIPQIIEPALIGADSTPEIRFLQKGDMYIYDTKEDKNFFVASAEQIPNQKVMWFPDSKHLIVVANKKVTIEEYDGANKTTIYAGPFVDSAVFPWPDATEVVILTNLGNSDILPNLYTIGLK